MTEEEKSDIEYVCVLDFEATCWDKSKEHEIIEFPSVLLKWSDDGTIEEVSRIQNYVKPKKNPTISKFCEDLTGITQKTINGGISLKSALKLHTEWLIKNVCNVTNPEDNKSDLDLTPIRNVLFITCGDWDLNVMLPMDLKSSGLKSHPVYKSYVNIKELFNLVTKKGKKSLVPMLEHFDLTLHGRHHSGIDDCHNISKIFIKLVEHGLTKRHCDYYLIHVR